jgi:hypothetical protein
MKYANTGNRAGKVGSRMDLLYGTDRDRRPQKGFWAPGYYTCECVKCRTHFIGDKRCKHCAPCAYDDAARRIIDATEGVEHG